MMWNNVAFELADMNRDLDQAMRLAFQAVADVQEQASKISLKNLSTTDLGTMQRLAMFWDTLGWVHYRRGELDKAERYVRAAWELSQNGEAADHLAQIYQAEKKKGLAENYYAMAIGAPGASGFKESEKRLEALVPSASLRAGRIAQAREELSKARTFHVPRPSSVNGSAEFFVVLDAQGAVEDAKFIDGNSSVQQMTSELKKVRFGFTMLPNSDAKLVRRGIMMCTSPAANCDFVVLTVDTVKTVF
jgi:tetratricopeptide (TPR) repeat protein